MVRWLSSGIPYRVSTRCVDHRLHTLLHAQRASSQYSLYDADYAVIAHVLSADTEIHCLSPGNPCGTGISRRFAEIAGCAIFAGKAVHGLPRQVICVKIEICANFRDRACFAILQPDIDDRVHGHLLFMRQHIDEPVDGRQLVDDDVLQKMRHGPNIRIGQNYLQRLVAEADNVRGVP